MNTEPHVNVDVVAHELGHGYVISQCDLKGGMFGGESGALNESIADIIAASTKQYLGILNKWTIGVNGNINRQMNDPKSIEYPDTYLGDFYIGSISAHEKGAVFSYWFYLLSEGGSGTNDNGINYNVSAIGMDNALLLVDRMLSAYFTSGTNYNQAAFYSLLAAADLYPNNQPYLDAILEAGIAVGTLDEGTQYPDSEVTTEIWLEAECATYIGSNFQTVISSDASKGNALQYTGQTDHNNPSIDIASKIYFDINFPSTGIYKITLFVNGEDRDHDSFFYSMNGNREKTTNGWGVNSPNTYLWHHLTDDELITEPNARLEFFGREQGAIIDKIYIELIDKFVNPVGFGKEATNCPIEPPLNTPTMEIGSCPSSATELSYTSVLGTPGSYRNEENTIAKVFDDNTNTFFDAPEGSGDNAWVGLDLGSEKEITCITYRPRQSWGGRMNGGKFEIADNASFTSPTVIYNIPSDGTISFQDYTIKSDLPISARYIRYVSPTGGWGNVAEITVNGIEVSTINFKFSDTKSKDMKNTVLRAYPIPSSNFVTIEGLNKHESYSIYNIWGALIINGNISNNEQIDIRNFTKGLYFLKFDNGNIIKFIKE
ncbi:M4 family metallopeptidase [Flavobacteriaceae bacterium]|nr:M4 family metallopeptidase [Flavobacteriaceae bacterium]